MKCTERQTCQPRQVFKLKEGKGETQKRHTMGFFPQEITTKEPNNTDILLRTLHSFQPPEDVVVLVPSSNIMFTSQNAHDSD